MNELNLCWIVPDDASNHQFFLRFRTPIPETRAFQPFTVVGFILLSMDDADHVSASCFLLPFRQSSDSRFLCRVESNAGSFLGYAMHLLKVAASY